MLHIYVPPREGFNSKTNEFTQFKGQHLQLEHSLVSLSKWESKWCKPFLKDNNKTNEEIIDYIRCMTITQNVDPETYIFLTPQNIKDINEYIEAPMTATTFYGHDQHGGRRETVTSELIYYWMIALNIPVEFQKWHLNRLLTLIRVCNIKNTPPNKRGPASRGDMMRSRAALNEARKKQLGTHG